MTRGMFHETRSESVEHEHRGPFRGAMGLEAHSSLARLQEAWPTVKGLADRPDDAAEWSGRKPDGKALRMAALQRAMS